MTALIFENTRKNQVRIQYPRKYVSCMIERNSIRFDQVLRNFITILSLKNHSISNFVEIYQILSNRVQKWFLPGYILQIFFRQLLDILRYLRLFIVYFSTVRVWKRFSYFDVRFRNLKKKTPKIISKLEQKEREKKKKNISTFFENTKIYWWVAKISRTNIQWDLGKKKSRKNDF